LTRKCDETTATTRAHAFLAALFGRTTVWVEEQTSSIENIAQHFRLYMTQNQKQNEANANRIKFYHEKNRYALSVVIMGVHSDGFEVCGQRQRANP
jgi:hypothetical protein